MQACDSNEMPSLWNFPGKNTGIGSPFPTPGDLPDLVIKLASAALAGRFFITEPCGKAKIPNT